MSLTFSVISEIKVISANILSKIIDFHIFFTLFNVKYLEYLDNLNLSKFASYFRKLICC